MTGGRTFYEITKFNILKKREHIVVVKKTFRYSNVFFYNLTSAYTAIP